MQAAIVQEDTNNGRNVALARRILAPPDISALRSALQPSPTVTLATYRLDTDASGGLTPPVCARGFTDKADSHLLLIAAHYMAFDALSLGLVFSELWNSIVPHRQGKNAFFLSEAAR